MQNIYSICLISLFSSHEILPAFICANNTESVVNSLFGVKIFNPFFLVLHHHLVVVAWLVYQTIFLFLLSFSVATADSSYVSSIKLAGLYVEAIVFLLTSEK